MTYDWNTPPTRPMPPEDVWTLMLAGCNAHEVAVAAGVCASAAVGLMRRAAMLNDRSKSTLHHPTNDVDTRPVNRHDG